MANFWERAPTNFTLRQKVQARRWPVSEPAYAPPKPPSNPLLDALQGIQTGLSNATSWLPAVSLARSAGQNIYQTVAPSFENVLRAVQGQPPQDIWTRQAEIGQQWQPPTTVGEKIGAFGAGFIAPPPLTQEQAYGPEGAAWFAMTQAHIPPEAWPMAKGTYEAALRLLPKLKYPLSAAERAVRPVARELAVGEAGMIGKAERDLIIRKFKEPQLQTKYDEVRNLAKETGFELDVLQGPREGEYWVHLGLPKIGRNLKGATDEYLRLLAKLPESKRSLLEYRAPSITNVSGQLTPSKVGGRTFLPFKNLADAERFLKEGDVTAIAQRIEFVPKLSTQPSQIAQETRALGEVERNRIRGIPEPTPMPPTEAVAPQVKEPWQMTREELQASASNTYGQRAKIPDKVNERSIGKPGMYYHVAEPDYSGGDIVSFNIRKAQGKVQNIEGKDEWREAAWWPKHAERVHLFDNYPEAYAHQAAYGGKILQINVPRAIKTNAEGFRYVDKIPSQWISREISQKGIVTQALSEGKTIPPQVLKDYPELAKPIPPAEAAGPPSAAPEVRISGLTAQEQEWLTNLRKERASLIAQGRISEAQQVEGNIGYLEAKSPAKPTVPSSVGPEVTIPPTKAALPPAALVRPGKPPVAEAPAPPSGRGPRIPFTEGPFPEPHPIKPSIGKPLSVPKPYPTQDILIDIRTRHPERLKGFEGNQLTINEAYRVRLNTGNVGENAVSTVMSRMRSIGDETKIFGIDDVGRATRVTPKTPGASLAIRDILENSTKYTFADPKAQEWISTSHGVLDSLKGLAKSFGVEINELRGLDEFWHYFPSQVSTLPTGEELMRVVGAGRLGSKIPAMRSRAFQYAQELALEKGFTYAKPSEALEGYVNGIYRLIANKQADDVLAAIGQTPKERMAQPIIDKMQSLTQSFRDAGYVKNIVNRMGRGEQATSSTIRAIERKDPDIAQAIQAEKTTKEIRTLALERFKAAQADFRQYTPIYRRAREIAGRPHADETFIFGQPGLMGRIFKKTDAAEIEKRFGEQVNPILSKASQLSRGLVTQQAAVDTSWPMIQGALILGRDIANAARGRPTATFAKSTRHMFETMFTKSGPKIHEAYMARTEIQDFLARNPLIMVGESDYYAGLPWMAKQIGKVPIAGRTLENVYRFVYGRAGAGFAAAGTRARIDTAMGLEKAWLNQGNTSQELAEFVNKLTGVISSKELGVGANMRAAESAAGFAPGFYRSTLMVLRDVATRNNATAQELRWALGSLLGGLTLAYYVTSKMAGQEPKMNPLPKRYGGDGADAFTYQVGNYRIGVPFGMWWSIMKMMGGVAGAATQEPEGLIQLDTTNPVLGLLVSKSSPIVSLGRELVTRQDFLGRELGGPEDWARELASKVIPIAAQDILTGKGPTEIPGEVAQFAGLRTWQMSTRDRLAYQMFGKPYAELEDEPNKQRLIRFHPEIIGERQYPGQKEVADIRAEQLTDDKILGQPGGLTPGQWQSRMYERLDRAAREQEKTMKLGIPHTEVQKAKAGYYAILDGLGGNPSPSQMRINSRKREDYLASLRPDLRDAVEDGRWTWASPKMVEFKEALKRLKPYFAITEKWKGKPTRFGMDVYDAIQEALIFRSQGNEVKYQLYMKDPVVANANAQIRQRKEWFRESNPEIDALLVKWYGMKPIARRQIQMVPVGAR